MNRSRKHPIGKRATIGLLALTVLGGCPEPLDTTQSTTRGTVGEEVFRVACKRFAADAYPNDVSARNSRGLCAGEVAPTDAPASDVPVAHQRLVSLARHRADVVQAIDTMLPQDLESPTDRLLVSIVPLYDAPEELLPHMTRSFAGLVTSLSADEAALGAAERLMHRQGYRAQRQGLGVIRPVLSYPGLDTFAEQVLAQLTDGASGTARLDALLSASALEMATQDPPDPVSGPLSLTLARDLLFTERDSFATGRPIPVARRDARGVAVPRGGVVAAPFVDSNHDGLADLDRLGHFADANGAELAVPTPFSTPQEMDVRRDAQGRAQRTDGTLYYDYADLDRSMLAALVRSLRPTFDPTTDSLLDMMRGLDPVLGPRTMRTERFGQVVHTYDGHDTTKSPVLDIVQALGTSLDRAEMDDGLSALDLLATTHENELASLIEAGLYGNSLADADTRAALTPNHEMWDDLELVLAGMTQQPGLTEGVLRAFADPRMRRAGQIIAEMMRYKDVFLYDPANVNASFANIDFTQPVDRNAPDAPGNQSIFQRSLSMIHDLNGVRMCNKANPKVRVLGLDVSFLLTAAQKQPCGLVEIPDAGEAYGQAVNGQFTFTLKSNFLNTLIQMLGKAGDVILEQSSGIDGLTTHPTPQAINRMVFAPTTFVTDLIDPPLTKDGVPITERHSTQVVSAWEREYVFCGDRLLPPSQAASCATTVERLTFYDTLAPFMQALYDADSSLTTGPSCTHVTPGADQSKPCYWFTELISAIYLHWPGVGDTTTQTTNPAAPFFVHPTHGVTYEPLASDILSDCVHGANGCTNRGARVFTMVNRLGASLGALQVRTGVDGFRAVASAVEVMADPQRNVGLRARNGSTTHRTSGGSRVVPWTPMDMFLVALGDIDDAFAAASDPTRHDRWLAGRSRLVDVLAAIDCTGAGCRFHNRTIPDSIHLLLSFARSRMAEHRTKGDVVPWSDGLASRAEAHLGSAEAAAIVHLVDGLLADPQTRTELLSLLVHLFDESGTDPAFDGTLLSLSDALQWLADDQNIEPLLQATSAALATSARESVAGRATGPLVPSGSTADRLVTLLRRISDADTEHTLPLILRNTVALPPTGDALTPIETLIDVISEVNRAPENISKGTHLDPEDYEDALGTTHTFLTDPFRGIERLYLLVQNRTLGDEP